MAREIQKAVYIAVPSDYPKGDAMEVATQAKALEIIVATLASFEISVRVPGSAAYAAESLERMCGAVPDRFVSQSERIAVQSSAGVIILPGITVEGRQAQQWARDAKHDIVVECLSFDTTGAFLETTIESFVEALGRGAEEEATEEEATLEPATPHPHQRREIWKALRTLDQRSFDRVALLGGVGYRIDAYADRDTQNLRLMEVSEDFEALKRDILDIAPQAFTPRKVVSLVDLPSIDWTRPEAAELQALLEKKYPEVSAIKEFTRGISEMYASEIHWEAGLRVLWRRVLNFSAQAGLTRLLVNKAEDEDSNAWPSVFTKYLT